MAPGIVGIVCPGFDATSKYRYEVPPVPDAVTRNERGPERCCVVDDAMVELKSCQPDVPSSARLL